MFRIARSTRPNDADVQPSLQPDPAPQTCKPPFDTDWYVKHAMDPEREPYADYLAAGSEAGRSPCPLFAPAWYLLKNPDVAVAGMEPLEHWLAFGWREGRDPSALFSTAAYLEIHPESRLGTEDPLTHFLRVGRADGVRCRPNAGSFDPYRPDVALVIVYEDDLAALELALWALRQGRSSLPVTLYLVCDGTEPARGQVDALAAAQAGEGLNISRLCQFGASVVARANAGVWAAKRAGRHSHIGLLDQATLLPSDMLRDLVDSWAPMVAPVLNIAETEQRVPIDFDIYASSAPLCAIAGFAERRRRLIPASVSWTDFVEPTCVLFEAGALESIGLLETSAATLGEALKPAFESAKRLGLGRPLIARHLYAHRLEKAAGLTSTNAPITPQRLVGAAMSAASDRQAIRNWSPDAPDLLDAHDAAIARAAEALMRELAVLRSQIGRASNRDKAKRDEDRCAWDEIAFGDPPRPPTTEQPLAYRAQYRRAHSSLLKALVARDCGRFDAALGLQPLLAELAWFFLDSRPVLVLTMDTDPVTGDEKDGYVQRVVAIDKALSDHKRIYLKLVEARQGRPALVFLDDGLWRLEVAHGDPLSEVLLSTILQLGACVYSQSLVGIDPPMLRKLLPARTGPFVMDMHGAVPEEFVLYKDHYMAQKYAEYETWAAGEADLVVSVTEAMAHHFQAKLGVATERSITCPIYMHSDASAPARPYHDRPRAIYAGGTQRWQRISELADVVAETSDQIDWCLLTPDVEGMGRALRRAGLETRLEGHSVRSASQAEVFATYPRCDFGLLLREPCVVNRVACPTKLIEYLRFGVVPVLETPDVGDFVEMGMRYVPVEDFRTGRWPTPEGRAEYAADNLRVFKALLGRSENGLARIAQAVGGMAPRLDRTEIRSTA